MTGFHISLGAAITTAAAAARVVHLPLLGVEESRSKDRIQSESNEMSSLLSPGSLSLVFFLMKIADPLAAVTLINHLEPIGEQQLGTTMENLVTWKNLPGLD